MKNTIEPFFISFAFAVFTFTACKKENMDETMDCSGSIAHYTSDIIPIINANCVSSGCHNAGSKNGDYTAYDGLKAIASNGKLERRIVINKNMPPAKPLSSDELKKINCWISSGAPNN